MLGSIPATEEIFILGDFNARVGRRNSATLMTLLSPLKTEALVTLVHRSGPLEISPSTDRPVHFTDAFKYLGSHIDWQLSCVPEIVHRLDQARKAFWKLTSSVWDVSPLRLKTKLGVYRSCVLSVGYLSDETRPPFVCLRKICHLNRWLQQQLSITNILAFLGVPTIEDLYITSATVALVRACRAPP